MANYLGLHTEPESGAQNQLLRTYEEVQEVKAGVLVEKVNRSYVSHLICVQLSRWSIH